MVTRAIVTGASGMLGGQLYRRLLAAGHEVSGWSNVTREAPDGVKFEPGKHSLSEPVDEIYHCAAVTDADWAETNPEKTHVINADWPGKLAARAAKSGARFVYVSTDAVYDGNRSGLHLEGEPPRPFSVYARTKLDGERLVLGANPSALVVRTTMFGWTLPDRRPKLAEEILDALAKGKAINLWTDAFFSPLHVADLADAILVLARGDCAGVINLGAPTPITRYQFGHALATEFDLDFSVVQAVKYDAARLRAPRPRNTGLDVSKAKELIGWLPSTWAGVKLLRSDWNGDAARNLRGRTTLP